MRGIAMAKRTYTQVQVLLPEIREMIAAGKTQREIAEHYGFSSKTVVKQLLNRERKKLQKEAAGIVIRPKGRPRKDALPRDIVAEQQYEINRLKMENKLLRDFLQSVERM
jgi:transposase